MKNIDAASVILYVFCQASMVWIFSGGINVQTLTASWLAVYIGALFVSASIILYRFRSTRCASRPLVLVGLIAAFIPIAYTAATHLIFGRVNLNTFASLASPLKVLSLIMLTYTAAAIEEVMYRGWLLSYFRKTHGIALSVTFSSILFYIAHLQPLEIGIFLYGVVFALIVSITGSLVPAVVCHWMVDAAHMVGREYFPSLFPGAMAKVSINSGVAYRLESEFVASLAVWSVLSPVVALLAIVSAKKIGDFWFAIKVSGSSDAAKF